MLCDFVPIVREVEIGRDKRIYPVADLHYGARNFCEKEWALFVDKIKNDDDALVVVAGDMMNNALKLSKSNVYEDVCRPSEQKAWLVEALKPIKHKILCGCTGNHEHRSVKEVDDNPLFDVFCKLDIEDRFRENGCFCIVRFITDENGNKLKRQCKELNPSYSLFVTHGGSLNKLKNFSVTLEGIDLVFAGHLHNADALPKARLVLDPQNNKVITKPYNVVITPSWLEYGGYALRDLYQPNARPEVCVTLSSYKKKVTVSQST